MDIAQHPCLENIYRDREADHQRLEKDYFSPKLEQIFRRRFRMGRHVFQILIHTFNKELMQWEETVYHHYKNVLQQCVF